MRDSDILSYLAAQSLQIEGAKDALAMFLNSQDCPPSITHQGIFVIGGLKQALVHIHNMRMALIHTNVPPINEVI